MSEKEKEIIKNMCECNMKVQAVADKMFMHRKSIVYHLDQIEKKFNLDPRCFHDLIRLEQMMNEESKN